MLEDYYKPFEDFEKVFTIMYLLESLKKMLKKNN
jgi:hypothetical protein